ASGLAKVHASRWGRRRVLRDNRNTGFRWWPALRQERKRAGDLRAQAILRLKLLQLRNALVARTRDALDEGFNDVKNLRDLRLLKGSQGAYDGKQVGSIALLDDHVEEQPELRMIQAIRHIPHESGQRLESLRFLNPGRGCALVQL